MKSRALIITLLVSAALIMTTPLVTVAAGPPPGKGPGSEGETASNNVSFPVIFSDNVKPTGWVEVTTWTFATITDPLTECVGEDDIIPPARVSPDILCYFGRKNLGLDEVTGLPVLVGDPKLWWLQQRTPNKWQVFTTIHDESTPLVVTGVDFGDLLESADPLSQKQVRTEVVLLQYVSSDDSDFTAADFYA
ncbi:MAG: hypothetical protein ACM3ON_04895, partial [Chloroflexota bacterium]